MECVNCIHFEVCQVLDKDFEAKAEVKDIETRCCLFEDSRKLLKLRFSKGDYFYYIDEGRIICDRVEDVRVGYIPRFFTGGKAAQAFGISDKLFNDRLFICKEDADEKICSGGVAR